MRLVTMRQIQATTRNFQMHLLMLLIRESSIGELELIEDDDSPFDDEEDE